MIRNLLVFDFDGTLSPIVADRRTAQIHGACQIMLSYLASLDNTCTAILSSRTLADLCSRITVHGVVLGGGSGAEWLLPDGRRIALSDDRSKRLRHVRANVLPELQPLMEFDGIDIEDKKMSIAVHVRNVTFQYRRFIHRQLEFLKFTYNLRLYPGPEAYELVLLPELNKPAGLMTLCDLIGFSIDEGFLVYAGDDAHDAEAMKLVMQHGGIAFTVGPKPLVPGAVAVADPATLAPQILKLFSPGAVSHEGSLAAP